MGAFRYLAIAPTGELTRGVMEAPSEAEVVARLRRQGSIPMRAEPDRGGGSAFAGLLRFAPSVGGGPALRRQELTNVTRELAVMLHAGQDLDRALRFLVDTAPNARTAGVLGQVRDAVRDGSPLAAALAKQPRSFPPLYIGLVRAGEAGGALAATLERLAGLLERERRLAATIKSAMIYPALLTVAAVGAITLLLTQVLPEFVPLFEQAGAALPRATQILIAVGGAVSSYGLYALFATVLLVIGAREALRRPGPRLVVDRLMLRLPLLGGLAREILAARLTRTLGTLLINGVPLIGALGMAREALGNLAGAAAVDQAATKAKDGAGLAGPLDAAGLFPLRTIHLLRL
ncbi:MAG: type II secretion system F family protein, partial [Alphaproteobacteria bacterium]|nr:type II secretion system F family protein [Alphaproteobacteria bacterium]